MAGRLKFRQCTIAVYREVGGRHNLPHCHTLWAGNRVSVALATWDIPAGASLFPNGVVPRSLRDFLDDHLDDLADEWDRLNDNGEYTMERWDRQEYMRMVSAVPDGTHLVVRFEDGDV